MKYKYKSKQMETKKIALERIKILFEQAKNTFKEDKTLSNKYVKMARELAMKYKIRIPRELKRRYCKHCYKYLMPAVNCRIRTREGKVIYYCLECKKYMKFLLMRNTKTKTSNKLSNT